MANNCAFYLEGKDFNLLFTWIKVSFNYFLTFFANSATSIWKALGSLKFYLISYIFVS